MPFAPQNTIWSTLRQLNTGSLTQPALLKGSAGDKAYVPADLLNHTNTLTPAGISQT